MHKDILLQYTLALDRGDFEALIRLCEQARDIPGLEDAIDGLHLRFDSHESFTEQLRQLRSRLDGQQAQ